LIFDLSSNLREGLQRKSFFEGRKKDCSGKPDQPKAGHAIKIYIKKRWRKNLLCVIYSVWGG